MKFNKQRIVEVKTGAGSTAVHKEGSKWYMPHDLKPNGRPYASALPRTEMSRGSGGHIFGEYATLIPEREAQAEPLRRRIFSLRRDADALEARLCGLYVEPPEPPPHLKTPSRLATLSCPELEALATAAHGRMCQLHKGARHCTEAEMSESRALARLISEIRSELSTRKS
jgi:hypothetical protein